MPKKKESIFTLMRKKENIETPKCLIELLQISGFDSTLSFVNMNQEKLKQIEDYIEKKRLDKYDLPAPYDTEEKFELLPGHKAFIIEFAERIVNTNDKRNNNKNFTEMTEEELSKKAEELDKALITQLISNFVKKTIPMDLENFDIELISKSEYTRTPNGQFRGKADIKCPLCQKNIGVNLNKYWYPGNYIKHAEAHFNKENIDPNAGQDTVRENGGEDAVGENDVENDTNTMANEKAGDNFGAIITGTQDARIVSIVDLTNRKSTSPSGKDHNVMDSSANTLNLDAMINKCIGDLNSSNQVFSLKIN